MTTINLTVSGLANQQIKTALKNALDKVEGVQEVDVNLALGTVTVGFNEPATEADIRSCTQDCGLTIA